MPALPDSAARMPLVVLALLCGAAATSGCGGEAKAPPSELGRWMYGVPREEVTKLLQEYGATLVAALGDTSAGREWTSFHYLAQKG